MRAVFLLMLLVVQSCTQQPCSDDDSSDPCEGADDPYLDSDSDGWPDCADCDIYDVSVPRDAACPEAA